MVDLSELKTDVLEKQDIILHKLTELVVDAISCNPNAVNLSRRC